MKNLKVSEATQDINVVNVYNAPQYMFEGIPSKYRSFFEFDVALIKEHHKELQRDKSEANIILQKAYFEIQ